MASASNESRMTKKKDSAKKRMWSATEEKQLLTICSDIEIAEQLDNLRHFSWCKFLSILQVFVYDFTGIHVKL